MKKLLIFFVILLSAFTVSSTTFAQSPTVSLPLSFGTLSPCPIFKGTRRVSADEAVEILRSKDASLLSNSLIQPQGQSYEERWIVSDIGNGVLIEVGCLVEVECGGHCNFADIVATWSKARSSGEHNWEEFYTNVTVGPPYGTSLRFRSRGCASVTVQNTLGAGFEAAGFSVSGSSTSTTTYRKVASIDVTWKVGDPLV